MNTTIRKFTYFLTASLLGCSIGWSQRGPQDNWYLEKTTNLPPIQGFDQPAGMSFSSSGDLYVANRDRDYISVWAPSGQTINAWGRDGSGDGQFRNVHDVHVHGNEVFATDFDNHRIQVFDLNGTFKRKFGSYGSGDGQLRKPVSIFVTSNGLNGPEVFVGEHDNNRISVFDLNGTFLRKFGSFNRPFGITLSPSGDLFASSTYSNVVKVYDINGTYLRDFNVGMRAFNLAFSGDKLVVAGGESDMLKIFETNGTLVKTIGTGSASNAPGEFNWNQGVTVDAGGDIHVSCKDGDRIQVFDSNGTYKRTYGFYSSRNFDPTDLKITPENSFLISSRDTTDSIFEVDENGSLLRRIGSQGSGDGNFSDPCEMVLTQDGKIVVADYSNHRIQILERNGTFVKKFGSNGTGDGQFKNPWGVALSKDNELFVTDRMNHRVQVFDLNGTFLRKWGTQGSLEGQLNQPMGIDVDDSGKVYVAEFGGNNRVSVFSTAGEFLYKFSTHGSKHDIVFLTLTPNGLVLTGGETTGHHQNNINLREKNGAEIKRWSIGHHPSGDGSWAPSVQLDDGRIVSVRRNDNKLVFHKQTYRSLVFEPSKKPPLCEVISVTQVEGSSNVDIKFRITDADSSKVKAGLIAFVDGGDDLSKVIVPKTFIGSVAGKLDENTTTGVTHTVTWNAQADWNVTYGNIELAVVAQDDRDLMNLHFLTLPGTDSNSTELKINRSPLSNTDLLNAWYTLLALGDSGIEITNGTISEPISSTLLTGFNPTSLSGLKLWLDATDVDGDGSADTLVNDANVSIWVDKSGQENNATQTTEYKKPSYKTNQLNGKPALFFDHSDDTMATSLNLTAPYTVGVIFNNLDVSGSPDRRAIAGSSNWLIGPHDRRVGHYAGDWVYHDSSSAELERYYLVVAVNDSTRSWCYVDGVDKTTKSWAKNSPNYLHLGRGGSGNTPLNGHIAEVLAFDQALGANDLENVHKYLHQKWDVGVNGVVMPYAKNSSTYAAGREYLFNKMNLREATSAEITRAKEAATPGVTNKFDPTFKVGPEERPEKVNEYNFETQQTGYWVVPKN